MDRGDSFDSGAVKFPGPGQERIAFASDDFSEEACLYRRIMSDLCVFMETDDTNCPADEGADPPLDGNEKLEFVLSACSISGSTPPGSKMRPITKKSREIDTVNVFDEKPHDSWAWQGQDDLSSAAFGANSNVFRRKGRNHRLPAAFNANANNICQSQNNCLPSAFSESADVLVRQSRIDCPPAASSENSNAGWVWQGRNDLEAASIGTRSAMALPPISTLGVANPYGCTVMQQSCPIPTHNDFFNNLLTKSVPIDVEYLNMFQIFLDRSPKFGSNTVHTPPAATSTNEYCAFCKKNGESSVVYTSHSLKALSGGRQTVTCPILREIVCKTCGATGDHAHTLSYCPLVKALNNGNKPESTAVLIRNSKIKSNGKPRY